MTDTALTGHEVIEQSHDSSLLNTDPAIVKGTVVGIVSAVASILVIGGYIDEEQKKTLADNAGVIVPAFFAIAAVAQALWTRMSVYSPRTAARIAVANAKAPAGAPPTLVSPP